MVFNTIPSGRLDFKIGYLGVTQIIEALIESSC